MTFYLLFRSSSSSDLYHPRLGCLLQINCIAQQWAFFCLSPIFPEGQHVLTHCAEVWNLAFKMEGHMTFHLFLSSGALHCTNYIQRLGFGVELDMFPAVEYNYKSSPQANRLA